MNAPPRKHPARKRFGQHFLTDASVIERIVQALRCQPTDRVLEIGPGTGAITERLCAAVGSMIAIEIDRDLAAGLRGRLPGLEVVCGDVLRTDLGPYIGEDGALRIVGNLPYNIATPLLDRLFGTIDDTGDPSIDRLRDAHFMLQAEVADRLCALPGTKSYGRLSVIGQYHCRIEPLFEVGPASFSPPPKVRSTFVRLTARDRPPCDVERLRRVLRTAFSQRRKTLANALKSYAPSLGTLGLDPGLRPENLSVDQFVAIANATARGHDQASAESRKELP